MGHTDPHAVDRVVLIATFAPRPQTVRGLETRMIAQGGSYSLLWNNWGSTFADYAHGETRMAEPRRTMRSLGLLKGSGWNLLSVASMRIINEEAGCVIFAFLSPLSQLFSRAFVHTLQVSQP